MDLVTRFEGLEAIGEKAIVGAARYAVKTYGPEALAGLAFTADRRQTSDEIYSDADGVWWPFYSFAAGRIVRAKVHAARVTGRGLWSPNRPQGGAALRVELTVDLEDGNLDTVSGWIR